MAAPALFAAKQSTRLNIADPDIRRQRVEELARISQSKRDRAWQTAADRGWQPKIQHGHTIIELMAIDRGRVYFYQTDNQNAAISVAADKVRQTSPFNLDGNSQIVGLWDGGAARTDHQELTGRVTVKDGAATVDHATHVAGTIAAAGVNSLAKGMAPAVSIDCYHWTNDVSEMTSRAMSFAGESSKIQVSNHSYSTVGGWEHSFSPPRWSGTWPSRESDIFGLYNLDVRNWDQLCYDAPYYLPFTSSGNDRSDATPDQGEDFQYFDPDKKPFPDWVTKSFDSATDPKKDGWRNGGFDTISPYGTAKNGITVGAVYDAVAISGQRDLSKATMTSFSSWGPTDDGRVKPDIVTNGVSVRSCTAAGTDSYATWSGTSTSSPGATGAAALLLEYYSKLLDGAYMKAATLKGLIVHTADDLGNAGPDYKFGFGLMNTLSAANRIKDHSDFPASQVIGENVIDNTQIAHVYQFQWDSVSPIRATLCWTDPPGPEQTGGLNDPTLRLINDLDITITSPDAVTTHYPWTLDPDNPANPATTGDNIRDNVEQIYIPDPNQPGIYTLEISYKATLTDGEQHYSLLLSGQSLVPDEPTDLSAQTGISCGQVLLEWTPSKGAAGYNIYYREDLPGPPFMPIQDGYPPSGSDVGDVNSLSITGLDSSKSYYFAATAYSQDGESDFSPQATAQPSLPCTISISGFVTTISSSAIENVAAQADNGGDTDTTAPDGFYQIEIPYGWTGGTVTPSKSRWTFEPADIFFPGPVLSSQTDQDFTGKAWADLDFDNDVDMSDLAIISRYYAETTCDDPNWCAGSDLDMTGEVGTIDIQLAVEQWLDIK